MPVIVSVLTFIIYYIIDNTGYKMARDGKWIVWMGMWMSSAILAPLGYFLTYKSNKDSVVLIRMYISLGSKECLGYVVSDICPRRKLLFMIRIINVFRSI